MCSLVFTARWEQGLQNLQGRGGTWQDEALLLLPGLQRTSGQEGSGCRPTFPERFYLHLGFHFEPFNLTCAPADIRRLSSLPISVSKFFLHS